MKNGCSVETFALVLEMKVWLLLVEEHKTFRKSKSNYFIVRPKVDQIARQLSLPHSGIFCFVFLNKFKLIYITPLGRNFRGAWQCVCEQLV